MDYLCHPVQFLLIIFRKIFGFGNSVQKSSNIFRSEGFFKVNVTKNMIIQLDEKFSDSSDIFPEDFETEIEISVALGKELYAACIESVIKQREAIIEIQNEVETQHQEFRNKLKKVRRKHERTEENCSTSDDSFSENCQGVQEEEYEIDGIRIPKCVDAYREKAREHLKERDKLFKNAKKCLKSKDKSLASNYFKQAEEHYRYCKEYNEQAYNVLLKNCFKISSNHIWLDLHGFTVSESLRLLDEFLDDNIEELENNERLDVIHVMVITGQGRHSTDGIPRVKQAVCARLKSRNVKFSHTNPGLLKVRIDINSLCTEDFEED